MSSFFRRSEIRALSLVAFTSALIGCASINLSAPAQPKPLVTPEVAGQSEYAAEIANSELVARIAGLAASDQYERNLLIGSQQDEKLSQQQKAEAATRFEALLGQRDGARLDALKAILAKTSLTQLAQIDGQTANLVLMMAIHADHVFQRSLVDEITALAKDKKISPQLAATFTDKLALGDGKPQVYGTQASCSSRNGGPLTWGATGMEPDAALDARRAAIGLEPFADYLANFPRSYGPCTEAWVVKPTKK
jgi:hypothetical protein